MKLCETSRLLRILPFAPRLPKGETVIKTLPTPTDTTFLEPVAAWPEQGQWTYEDYLRLPTDGRRYEIVQGVLYVASAPSYIHQYVVGEIHAELRHFVKKNKLGIVLPAPFDVRLPNQRGVIQPDVLFIRAENMPDPETVAFRGVPDLVVEVLSPSTRRYDTSIKLDAYEQAGVREYWIVDPIARFALVYSLPENGSEYVLAGEFTPKEHLTSPLLPDFSLLLADVLPPGE